MHQRPSSSNHIEHDRWATLLWSLIAGGVIFNAVQRFVGGMEAWVNVSTAFIVVAGVLLILRRVWWGLRAKERKRLEVFDRDDNSALESPPPQDVRTAEPRGDADDGNTSKSGDATYVVDDRRCPECSHRFVMELVIAGGIGPPTVTCPKCQIELNTGRVEWPDAPAATRRRFVRRCVGTVIFGSLLTGAPMGLGIALLLNHVIWSEPTNDQIGLLIKAGLIGAGISMPICGLGLFAFVSDSKKRAAAQNGGGGTTR